MRNFIVPVVSLVAALCCMNLIAQELTHQIVGGTPRASKEMPIMPMKDMPMDMGGCAFKKEHKGMMMDALMKAGVEKTKAEKVVHHLMKMVKKAKGMVNSYLGLPEDAKMKDRIKMVLEKNDIKVDEGTVMKLKAEVKKIKCAVVKGLRNYKNDMKKPNPDVIHPAGPTGLPTK